MIDQDIIRVQAAVNALREHFDSVQIFCTRFELDGTANTSSIKLGGGNWYARRGQVAEWLTKANEEARIEVRRENEES